MLDFTSASYLGLRHGADRLGQWAAIAHARPAALAEPALLVAAGRAVARLQGEEDGVVGPSTLSLAMDVLGPALGTFLGRAVGAARDGAPRGPWTVLVDAGCYPLLLWAARQRGTPPLQVAHFRPSDLARVLARLAPGARPILAVDGYCVGCGRTAPLGAYAAQLRRRGGRLLVDDTQAIGLLGRHGAGTAAGQAARGTVLRLASLAKGFNVPLAVLSGSRDDIARFRAASLTRMLCSPPAIPVARAALRALRLNRAIGDRLRALLRSRVATFRAACAEHGVPLRAGSFPVQTVDAPLADAPSLLARLEAAGLRAFASRGYHDDAPRLRLVVTAIHAPDELARAAGCLSGSLAPHCPTRERHDA